jgi:hypothetical protein
MSSDKSLLSYKIDLSRPWRWICENPSWVLLLIGSFLAIWGYLLNRSYWLDELSLAENLVGMPVFDFRGHLKNAQLAPLGFLVIERIVVKLAGYTPMTTRVLPLLCGLGSLWLFRALCLRWLSLGAALVAMAMFALWDDLQYYSSELKPYTCDLLVSLTILTITQRVLDQPVDQKRFRLLGLLAIAAPWFSFSSAFIVAGCGLMLLIESGRRRDQKSLMGLSIVSLVWVLSLALSYLVSKRLLTPENSMYDFWGFAFAPFPPHTKDELTKLVGMMLEVFVNPLNMLAPHLPIWCVILPAGLFVLGAISFGRRQPMILIILITPIVLSFLGSAVRAYPFHGRLILGLIPAYFLMIAEGTCWIHRKFGKKAQIVVIILLLAYPCIGSFGFKWKHRVRDYNRHGDLHTNRFMN